MKKLMVAILLASSVIFIGCGGGGGGGGGGSTPTEPPVYATIEDLERTNLTITQTSKITGELSITYMRFGTVESDGYSIKVSPKDPYNPISCRLAAETHNVTYICTSTHFSMDATKESYEAWGLNIDNDGIITGNYYNVNLESSDDVVGEAMQGARDPEYSQAVVGGTLHHWWVDPEIKN